MARLSAMTLEESKKAWTGIESMTSEDLFAILIRFHMKERTYALLAFCYSIFLVVKHSVHT